jgi:hypothetical protein
MMGQRYAQDALDKLGSSSQHKVVAEVKLLKAKAMEKLRQYKEAASVVCHVF